MDRGELSPFWYSRREVELVELCAQIAHGPKAGWDVDEWVWDVDEWVAVVDRIAAAARALQRHHRATAGTTY